MTIREGYQRPAFNMLYPESRYFDRLMQSLERMLLACSKDHDGIWEPACTLCPAFDLCHEWWEKVARTSSVGCLKPEAYKRFSEEFAPIKESAGNGNGHKNREEAMHGIL